MADSTPGTAPVTDHRMPPRGVLPRHAQTWLMVAVALGILGIIVFTGIQLRRRAPSPPRRRPSPPRTPTAARLPGSPARAR